MNKLLIILFSLTLVACGAGNSAAPDSQASEAVAVPVEAVSASRGSVVGLYSATASLEADSEARVVPRMAGRVVEILAEEGDRVRAGQVLARVDDDRLRLELARAEAELNRLRQDHARQREMHQRQLISAEAFERVQYQLEAQQAMVDLARLELSHAAITAPFAGVVSERMLRLGNMVDTITPVFVVTAMDPLRAVLHVPERELGRLSAGQSAELRADALPGQRFPGKVARVAPVVDAQSGTVRVTIEVSDSSGALRPGMFGRFEIVHDRRDDVVLVPVEAVISEDGRHSVFVIEDGQARRRSVVTGYRNNGHFEIIEGLSPGERVVTTGQNALRSGSLVMVIGDDTSGALVEDARSADSVDLRA